jgi:serine/threonine protein kinase/formylglycine-generating enzyme required for sulfatase activity/dienelactone hydrolase
MMNNQEQSAQRLFGAALDLPVEYRSAFLDQACRESPELRRLVDELLLQNQLLGNSSVEPLSSAGGEPSIAATSPVNGNLAAGTKLGRYSIVELIGAGGMGVVYRARDEKLERAVAIKILSPGLLTGDDARHRFHKEALALAKLSSPHIAAVYDVGEQDGVDYIVMECVPGESLATRLRSGPLAVKDATSIALQIAQALEEAHEQGVIHRDLKPANVMVTPKGQVKVLDFGLAKLLEPQIEDSTQSIMETRGLAGTPLYMSPEQAYGNRVDTRTDLWSLGVVYYESLTASRPFQADSTIGVLRAITEKAPTPLRQIRADAPALAEQIVGRALEKDPASRYQSASQVIGDTSDLLSSISTGSLNLEKTAKSRSRIVILCAAIVLLVAAAGGLWFYRGFSNRRWAREEAIPQITDLLASRKSLAAFNLLQKAQQYLPADPALKQIADQNTVVSSITSSPTGAAVEIQDYLAPDSPWRSIGTTPLTDIRLPKGYFRWKVSKPGGPELVVASDTNEKINFALDTWLSSPPGMVPVPASNFGSEAAFVGWIGPYKLPQYYIDRYEVTNRDYQKFVDSGGYEKREYWPEKFTKDGHDLSWSEAMAEFRDPTGRAGPSTWAAGHYPEGKADFPVSGVSWFEASAYAAFVGKHLPALIQWLQTTPPDDAAYAVPVSNLSTSALAAVGTYKGVGPYGTYDTAGNVREWVANTVDDNLHFILGGSWESPPYMYSSPEALPPFDRSEGNGFRCVQNTAPLPEDATKAVKSIGRDFSRFKPASDDVFHAYQLLYAYPKTPLHETNDGIVQETADWREEKVTFDTGYRGQRMSAYLFLPKNVHPPYQTVLFSPSARVMFIRDNKGGRNLGDIQFFDYIVQSGRAVMYPIYEDTYERRVKYSLPSGAQNLELTTDWYKDAARSLDYLATRPDIDNTKLAFLGVSMGSAQGVITSALMQDRLKTAILLDGGYFLETPPPGGDQADFAPRMKRPVLMVNGRYDFTFPLEKAQNPLFEMLGTPAEDKRHVILETPHDVTEQRPQLMKAVLDWLDRYLGRVNQ